MLATSKLLRPTDLPVGKWRLRHWLASTANSHSATFSQLPCLGRVVKLQPPRQPTRLACGTAAYSDRGRRRAGDLTAGQGRACTLSTRPAAAGLRVVGVLVGAAAAPIP
jgi:hypothetical protein